MMPFRSPSHMANKLELEGFAGAGFEDADTVRM